MKYIFLLLAFTLPFTLSAQDEEVWKEASKESQVYHQARIKPSVPPYGLERIKGLVDRIRSVEDENLKLDHKTYMGLSLREKFTYHMIHAESYSQNCDAMPPIQEEQLKVFGYLPDAFNEYSWSERQSNFLKSNRDTVMALIRESVSRSKRIGVNYKMAIVEINAREMIPFLIKAYKSDKKDHDILTVLMLMMKNNEYKPFMASQSFRKLYGTEASYQAYLTFNKANEDLILNRASDFYQNR